MSGLPPSLLSLLVTRPVSTRDQDAMDTDDSIRSTISSANTDTSLRAPQVTPQQRRQVTTTPSQSMQTDLDTPTNTRPVLSHQSSSVREIPSSTSSTSYPAYPSYPGSYRGRPPTPSPISNDAPDRAGDYKMGDSTQSRPTPSTPSPPLRNVQPQYFAPSSSTFSSSYPPAELRPSYRGPADHLAHLLGSPARPSDNDAQGLARPASRFGDAVSPKDMTRDIHSADSDMSSHPPSSSRPTLSSRPSFPAHHHSHAHGHEHEHEHEHHSRSLRIPSRTEDQRRYSSQSHPYERPQSVEVKAQWQSSYPGRRPGDGTSMGSRAPICRATKACNACRARKVRCDVGGDPGPDGQLRACSRCRNADVQCVYVVGQRKRGPLAGTTRSALPLVPSTDSLADQLAAASVGPRRSEPYHRYYPNTQRPDSGRDSGGSSSGMQQPDSGRDSGRSSFGSIETAPLLTPDEMSRRESFGFSPQPYGPPQQLPFSAPPRFGSTLMPGPPPPLPPVPGSPTRQGKTEARPLTMLNRGNSDNHLGLGGMLAPRGYEQGLGPRESFPSSSYEGGQQSSGPSQLFGSSGRVLPPLPGLSAPALGMRRESYRG